MSVEVKRLERCFLQLSFHGRSRPATAQYYGRLHEAEMQGKQNLRKLSAKHSVERNRAFHCLHVVKTGIHVLQFYFFQKQVKFMKLVKYEVWIS